MDTFDYELYLEKNILKLRTELGLTGDNKYVFNQKKEKLLYDFQEDLRLYKTRDINKLNITEFIPFLDL